MARTQKRTTSATSAGIAASPKLTVATAPADAQTSVTKASESVAMRGRGVPLAKLTPLRLGPEPELDRGRRCRRCRADNRDDQSLAKRYQDEQRRKGQKHGTHALRTVSTLARSRP
jgi:hypothetical protein